MVFAPQKVMLVRFFRSKMMLGLILRHKYDADLIFAPQKVMLFRF
jgi:hypothetical protein